MNVGLQHRDGVTNDFDNVHNSSELQPTVPHLPVPDVDIIVHPRLQGSKAFALLHLSKEMKDTQTDGLDPSVLCCLFAQQLMQYNYTTQECWLTCMSVAEVGRAWGLGSEHN
jgi:hypothetical protein